MVPVFSGIREPVQKDTKHQERGSDHLENLPLLSPDNPAIQRTQVIQMIQMIQMTQVRQVLQVLQLMQMMQVLQTSYERLSTLFSRDILDRQTRAVTKQPHCSNLAWRGLYGAPSRRELKWCLPVRVYV